MYWRGTTGFIVIVLLFSFFACQKKGQSPTENKLTGNTWAEKLGYPKDKRVLILHADDSGMCPEANEAAITYLQKDDIQSTSVMMPCSNAEDMIKWYKDNPTKDIGIHITLTSEWKNYRWGPVSDTAKVPGLIDSEGFMWRDVPNVVRHATPQEIETEIRAQIEKALSLGVNPGHMDTHMGTVYGHPEFAKVYMNIAMEYEIPAMVIEFTDPVLARFRKQGYPITDDMIGFIDNYTLPKLDDFHAAPNGSTYDEKKQKFFELVQSLQPGITEIIFHPSTPSDNLKSITNSWQQRVWEQEMFSDPSVNEFFKNEGIIFTNWKEMMARFKERS